MFLALAWAEVPWLTVSAWATIGAARTGNAKARAIPQFHDAAQMLASLENGAGVLADFSYLAPDRLGYQLADYWRIRVHGSRGLAETHLRGEHVTVITDGSEAPELRPVGAGRRRGYLTDFLAELRGITELDALTSAQCLRASRLALETEAGARG